MKAYNFILHLALLFAVAILFSSCESSKVAFGNSSYFKQAPKELKKEPSVLDKSVTAYGQKAPDVQKIASEELYVSAEVLAAQQSIQERIIKVEQRIDKLKVLEEEEKDREINNTLLSRADQKALKKEKVTAQKAFKKEVKALAKEYKKAPEEVKEQHAVSGNTRTGIILGAVGLILLIIGGPVLYTVGTILLVVGLVIILIDVL